MAKKIIARVGKVYIPRLKVKGNDWPDFFIKVGNRMFVPKKRHPISQFSEGMSVAFESALNKRPISRAFNVRHIHI